MAGPYAFVTLVSSDAYLPGALAQVAALRDLHPSPPAFPEVPFQTVCLVTPETVDITTIKLLLRAFHLVIGVEVLEQDDDQNLQLLGRPDLTTVLTKLHVFRLTQYSKIVFLDADVLPIRQLSHLFNIPHDFAAAPDVGWPDIFNSGVLVVSPGKDKFHQLSDLLKSKGSWDGGDQGLLNEWRAGDWHRLSFTYNTTPTAAYTYAPAYERYGSQINAIHFIGPNKPWTAIPFRTPFLTDKRATSSQKKTGTSQQAYDYESLVDRWFAIYDKHYRSQPLVTPSFQVKRYPSAWNSSSSGNPSVEIIADRPFTLEDLRKIAIEGMIGAGLENISFPGQAGEGEYRSLPLEGRFDLMRPRKPPPIESDEDSPSTPGPTFSPGLKMMIDYLGSERDLPMTPVPRQLGLPEDPNPVLWHTLPTLGPGELPPSAKIPLKSLPATPLHMSDYYASSAGPTSDSEGWGSLDKPIGHASLFPSQQPPSRSTSQGEHPHSVHHFGQNHNDHDNNGHCQDHSPQGDVGRHHYPHSQSRSQHSFSRPPSPSLVSWNPAVEPPPNDPPSRSGLPVDTYLTNVWDLKPHQERPSLHKGVPGHPSVFFRAPPPPQIPKPLLEQGHYRNVTGGTSGSPTNPDSSKVKSIFPWEDKPRQFPGRVFPESDTPSPARFVGPTTPTTPPTPTPKLLDKNGSGRRPYPSSIPRVPTTLSFTNAWDGDPSIQNYASRLVRSPPALHPSSAVGWDEKVEASSQDGDDEDEGDEDEDEDAREVDSDDDKRSRPRTWTPSVAEDTKQVQKSAMKIYRSLGVQTIPREKRSQSVQVSALVEASPSQAASRRSSISSRRSLATSSGSSILQGRDANRTPEFLVKSGASSAPGSIRSRSVSSGSYGQPSFPSEHTPRPQRDFITSPLSQPQRPPARSFPPHIPESRTAPTPPRASTPRLVSPPTKITPPPKGSSPSRPSIQTNRNVLNPSKAPSISQRQVSNDSSIGSPPSSTGPVSPPDDHPSYTPSPTTMVRKGTRVWDPARGVELFKRGSEEVLARFLKMDSWDENTR